MKIAKIIKIFTLIFIGILLLGYTISSAITPIILLLLTILYTVTKSRKFLLSKLHIENPKPYINAIIIFTMIVISVCSGPKTEQASVNKNNNYAKNIEASKESIKHTENSNSTKPSSKTLTTKKPIATKSTKPTIAPTKTIIKNTTNKTKKPTVKPNKTITKKTTTKPIKQTSKRNTIKPIKKNITKATHKPVKKSNKNNNKTTKNTSSKTKPKPAKKSNNKQINQTSGTVYITATGYKYHRGNCGYLSRSKYSISLKDAKARGYTACSRCY